MDRQCWKCGVSVSTKRGRPVCDDCKWRQIGRARVNRVCESCDRHYRTSSGSYLCASCIHRRNKHPCEQCGEPCDKRAKLCRTCLPPGANARGARRGAGRYIGAHGYVLIRVEDDPRGLYRREHIIVMEQRLGRYLLPGESVHHKNGIKHDNRDDNLELWVVNQPSGQRAEDLLTWAREIIKRYESLTNADASA